MTKSRSPKGCVGAESCRLRDAVVGKRVLFVATTYVDYLRIQQELKILKKYAKSVDLVVSKHKSYFVRLCYVYVSLLFKPMKQFDVVFLGFLPQLIQLFWWWKFRKKTVITDFFISLYDTLVHDRRKFKDGKIIAKWLLWLDRFTVSRTDLLIADTKLHAHYFCSKMNGDVSKTMVLYLQADAKYYYPKHVVKDKTYKGHYIVFYFATVLPLQGVDLVIDAISQITNSKLHFIFVGPLNSVQKDKLFMQKKLTYYRWLGQEQLSELIAQSDLCLAGHFNNSIEKAKRTIPGKAYIFEAMNKEIILGENEANKERYPEKYGKVNFVKMGSVQALKESILSAAGVQNDDKS